jgi:hypothetical protein
VREKKGFRVYKTATNMPGKEGGDFSLGYWEKKGLEFPNQQQIWEEGRGKD